MRTDVFNASELAWATLETIVFNIDRNIPWIRIRRCTRPHLLAKWRLRRKPVLIFIEVWDGSILLEGERLIFNWLFIYWNAGTMLLLMYRFLLILTRCSMKIRSDFHELENAAHIWVKTDFVDCSVSSMAAEDFECRSDSEASIVKSFSSEKKNNISLCLTSL